MPLDGSVEQFCKALAEAQLALGFQTDGWPKRPARKWGRKQKQERGIQLALHLEDAHCTPLMLRVEGTLRRLVNSGEPMPSYELLNTLAGGKNRSSVFRAVQRLANLKRLHVQQEPQRRRVVMLFDGGATEWAPFRPGHAPRSRRPKRAPAIKLAPVQKIPRSRFRPSGLGILPAVVPPGSPDLMGYAQTCQYPLWCDGAQPDGAFCGARSSAGTSFCRDHHAMVYLPKRKP